ncbi:4Fe-4S dicluster domain-containing protein [Deltaproteobacteria bacterium TL4]
MENKPEFPIISPELTRRDLLKKAGVVSATVATATVAGTVVAGDEMEKGQTFSETVADFFQKHYKRMTPEEVEEAIARLENQYKRKYGVAVKVGNTPPLEGVLFGYALNLSKCKGLRKCVDACVAENNQNRDSQIQYIRVLEIEKGSINIEEANHYYDPETVPQEDKFYLPVQCHQCEDAPCVKACPTKATWKEPDGIIVVDYNWCIGCRYCMTACPYWSRRFNWNDPKIPQNELNPDTHYLSNRPRFKGVVEKCTFCLQRTRQGRLPACHEACPTGARVFGNLLDPDSDIRYILKNKTVFRLKEDLKTDPKFWYYTD